MNASKILQQLMQQAGGRSGGTGVDVKGMLDGLSRHLGGGASGQASNQPASDSGGLDMKSLLGGGAMGLLVGSKRGRKLGGKARKYGAIAAVGTLAWTAWLNELGEQDAQPGAAEAGRNAAEGGRIEDLRGKYQARRSLELLQVVIMASSADAHIEAQERELIAK